MLIPDSLKYIFKFTIFSVLLLMGLQQAQAATKHQALPKKAAATTLQQVLTRILNKYHSINTGVLVQSLDNKKIIYASNADRTFVPASNLKLFTAAAAVWQLGPQFIYQTQILTNAKAVTNGVVPGDVYIKFSGDPTLTKAQLDDLIANLQQQNIHTISGNVYLDDSAYDKMPYGHGWMWDDENICFSAPMSAIIVDHNCFDFALKPAAQLQQPAQMVFKEVNPYVTVENHVITSAKEEANCPLDLQATRENHYILTGCLAQSIENQPLSAAIKNPELYTKALIRDLLKQHHIVVSGRIDFATSPPAATVLANHTSAPLSELINTMLKKSDNLIANSLFKKIGADYFKAQGSWENGAMAVSAILQTKAGLDLTNANINDGSGDSRYTLVTPAQIIQLLTAIYHDPHYRDLTIKALPIAGVDGSLEKRMKETGIAGKVQAKTGSMTGVSSLSGFIQTKAGHHLVFSIISNNFVNKEKDIRDLQDQICKLLVQRG